MPRLGLRYMAVMRTWLGGALAASLLLGGSARAQEGASADPLVQVAHADPLELGRVAARLGDGAVLARLSADRPVAVCLAAIRATPLLRAPEAALGALAELAAGRDSYLAPAAALAVLRIARALTPDALAAREVLPSDLAPARAALESLASDERARPDIRRAAGLAAAALAALSQPGG